MDKIDYDIPFYKNHPKGTHCFQACFKMVIKHFWPEEEYSLGELAKITKKKPGGYTWYYAGLIWLTKRGVEVEQFEPFDNLAFAERGKDYLVEIFGKEVADIQDKNSDIPAEQQRAREFIKKVKLSKKIPSIVDLKSLLKTGHIAICVVNSRALNRNKGYSGHFALVKGFDKKGFILHDPGLPGKPNRHVSFDIFEKAWAYPNEMAKTITAIKLTVR